jgi:hypothetical protein
MPFNGSGTYSRDNGTYTGSTVWAQDNANGYKIVDTRHDLHDQDIATALSSCLVKDGQQSPTANLPMAGFKHTNVAVASARTDYARYSQVQDSSPVYATGGGTATAYTLTLSPAVTAYAAGQRFFFFANAGNSSGAVTLNVNGVGAVGIKKNDGTANGTDPEAFAIQQYDLVEVVHNGTVFILAGKYENIRPATNNTFALGSAALAFSQSFTRKISADTGQDLTLASPAGSAQWTIGTSSGDITQDGSNGGDIVLSRDNRAYRQSVEATVTAAGVSQGTATPINKLYTVVTAGSGGVTPSDAWPVGCVMYITNLLGTTLTVYTAGSAKFEPGPAASITVASGASTIIARASSLVWTRVSAS